MRLLLILILAVSLSGFTYVKTQKADGTVTSQYEVKELTEICREDDGVTVYTSDDGERWTEYVNPEWQPSDKEKIASLESELATLSSKVDTMEKATP